jgi:hypothetical protein
VHPVNFEYPLPTVALIHAEDGTRIEFEARQEGVEGRYVAALSFPSAGRWTMEIAPGPFLANLVGVLEVADEAPAQAAGNEGFLNSERWWVWLAPALATLGLAPAAVRGQLGKRGVATSVLGIALLGTGAAWWSAGTVTAAQPEVQIADADYGKTLFLAKGCTSCHIHAEAKAYWSTEMGPALTEYVASPEFVFSWLKDPASIKPDTLMPNLELKEGEIEALVAFLVGEAD